MLYIVSEIFYLANFKNKAMTASVCGRNFAVKFQRPELENFVVYKLHIFVLFFCFVHKFQNACELIFSNFSSEAEHILALFLFFGQIEPQCS